MKLKQCVHEGCDSRPLRQHDERPEHEQDEDDRQQPKLFPLLHESPQLQDKLAHASPPKFHGSRTGISYENVDAAGDSLDTSSWRLRTFAASCLFQTA